MFLMSDHIGVQSNVNTQFAMVSLSYIYECSLLRFFPITTDWTNIDISFSFSLIQRGNVDVFSKAPSTPKQPCRLSIPSNVSLHRQNLAVLYLSRSPILQTI